MVADASLALTVTRSFTAFSLTLDSPSYEPINYAGTVTGKTMVGSLNGSGLSNLVGHAHAPVALLDNR